MSAQHRYFMIHKPYGMESQFKPNYPGVLLGELDFDFPEGTHAIGRLDKPSEGLLLLTTDSRITKLLFQSKVPHKRTYAVQVRGKVTKETLDALVNGVSIRITNDDFHMASASEASVLKELPSFPSPKVISPHIETTWLSLTLEEGKFRQVRKMVAALRHKCLRLIRTSIEDLELGDLPAGGVREMSKEEFFRKLRLSEQ